MSGHEDCEISGNQKLRDKISEEVQQTSLRLPATVQHLSQLSPFGSNGGETGFGDTSKNAQNLHDELLVDISDIQPAGDNKDLFSIDEDSREGSPSKSSEFQVVELTDEGLSSYDDNHNPFNQGQSPLGIGGSSSLPNRRSSDGSHVSDMSNLFPIYEVPGVSFNVPQSDLESCSSEWEDGNNALDRLSKDTVYQAYVRMRQRYHKYKGRYSDLLRVYKEKDKETEKLRDVLTKQQDKALRRISELREQCSLEQQAKAHLEEELRSDLEERDHKIEALQTKVRLLQEGCFGDVSLKVMNISEGVGLKPSTEEGGGSGAPSLHGEFDTVSVGSLGSLAAPSSSVESEEVIDKLKEHEGMLESLRSTVESSALSMAETKQQLFEELQTKEQEVERYRRSNLSLQKTIDRLKEDIAQGRIDDEELEINLESQSHVSSDEVSVKSFENLELKVTELENLIGDLQRSKMNLELELKQLKEEKESRDSGYFVTGSEKEGSSTLTSENSKEGIGSSESSVSSDQTLNSLQENMEDSAIDVESSRNLHSACEKTKNDQDFKTQNLVDLTQQLEQLQIECERLKAENESLSSELRNLNDENESLNAEVSSLNDENETLHRDFKSIEDENEKLDSLFKEQTNTYNEKISSLQRELMEVRENLSCKEKEKEEVENLFKKLGNDFDALKEDESKFKAEIENLNASLKEKCSLIETFEKKLVIAEKNVMDTKVDYQKSVDEVNSLRKSMSDYENTIASLKNMDLEYKEKLDETDKKLISEVKQSEKLRSELGDLEDILNKHVKLMFSNNISVPDNILCKLEAVISSSLDLDSKTKDLAKENNDLVNQVKDFEEKLCDFDKNCEKYSSLSVQYDSLKERFETLVNKEKELNILNEELNNKLQESDKEFKK
ncbi:Golgin subfamily A member 4, partial [Armadillidium vulgare]